jgi:hypothetical protein
MKNGKIELMEYLIYRNDRPEVRDKVPVTISRKRWEMNPLLSPDDLEKDMERVGKAG